jgi:hypothetical protein
MPDGGEADNGIWEKKTSAKCRGMGKWDDFREIFGISYRKTVGVSSFFAAGASRGSPKENPISRETRETDETPS